MDPDEGKIEAVSAVNKSKGLDALEKVQESHIREGFDVALNEAQPATGAQVQPIEVRPVEESNKVESSSARFAETRVGTDAYGEGLVPGQVIEHLDGQIQQAYFKTEEAERFLNSSDGQTAVNGLLEHNDDFVRSSLESMGFEFKPGDAGAGPSSVLEKFIGFVSKSQNRLGELVNDLKIAKAGEQDGKVPSMSDMMAVQLKVSFVQNEMEFFTNILNRGLEASKSLLNVQI